MAGARPLRLGGGGDALLSLETGAVLGWIDLTGLLNSADARHPADVLNGIAIFFDRNAGKLYVAR